MKKRLVNILLFIVLLIVPFIVKADPTYTINVKGSNSNHTYQAYQIFGGTVANGRLSNVTWGSGVDTDALIAAHPEMADPVEVTKTLSTEPAARAFANLINDYLTASPTSTCAITGSTCSMTGLAGGYYLIKDVDASLNNSSEIYTPYILSIVEDKEIRPKISSIPYIDSFIILENSSTTMSAATTVGKDIDYVASVYLPDDYTLYPQYKLVVNGNLGTSFNIDSNSFSVQVDGTTIDSGYTVAINDDHTFTVTFNDLTGIASVTDSSRIDVFYTLSLNSSAATGSTGNTHGIYINYTNNANIPNEATGLSETIETYVYTGQIVVQSTDEDGNPLEGAGYTLINQTTGSIVGVVDSSDASKININGVGSGTYTLRQTAAPDGYEQIEDVTISVTVDEYSGSVTVTSISNNQITIYNETEYVLLQIPNKYSALLAFTGGRGTLVYTVTGLTIMGLAILLILIRKKHEDIED